MRQPYPLGRRIGISGLLSSAREIACAATSLIGRCADGAMTSLFLSLGDTTDVRWLNAFGPLPARVLGDI